MGGNAGCLFCPSTEFDTPSRTFVDPRRGSPCRYERHRNPAKGSARLAERSHGGSARFRAAVREPAAKLRPRALLLRRVATEHLRWVITRRIRYASSRRRQRRCGLSPRSWPHTSANTAFRSPKTSKSRTPPDNSSHSDDRTLLHSYIGLKKQYYFGRRRNFPSH